MGYGIRSEDFAAIALFLAGGDADITLVALDARAATFFAARGRYMGTYEGDFRGALDALVYETERDTMPRSAADTWERRTLASALGPMLSYHEIYWNDSETSWCEEPDASPSDLHRALAGLLPRPRREDALSLLRRFHWNDAKTALYLAGEASMDQFDDANILAIDHSREYV